MIPISLQAARVKLSRSHPYLAAALWRLDGHESEQCSSMGVDEYYRLYVNKKWVEELSVDVLSTVLYHEIMHLLRMHPSRCKGLGAVPRVWNGI